jgi:hypothetical protein
VAPQGAAWDLRKNPQDTERPAERQAARFRQEKIWRGASMSKGCDEAAGDTSGANPDPESPLKTRGQAARKGGRERGSEHEETRTPTRRDSGGNFSGF